jgi:hypothetical protein
MNWCVRGGLALALACAAGSASAGVVFSDVSIGGSLAAGASFYTSNGAIDFVFPAASVGDTVDPLRSGDIVITYEATGTGGDSFNSMLAFVLGALSGSGQIFFHEVVEDLNGGGVIADFSTNLTQDAQLPFVDSIAFDQASTHFKVTKTITLDAIETAAFDLANVSLVEQTLIPSPGALAALGMVLIPALGRRRN